MTDYDVLASSLVSVGCLAKRKRTTNRRVRKRLDMEQFHYCVTMFVKGDRETGKVAQKSCLFCEFVARSSRGALVRHKSHV